jgi:hypothetical protein
VAGYQFDLKSVRRISQAVRRQEATPRSEAGNPRQKIPGDQRYFAVANASGEDVPAFGLLRLTGSMVVSEEFVLPSVDMADDSDSSIYCIAGPQGIPEGENGLATVDGPVYALYDSGTPTIGSKLYPKPDTFHVSTTQTDSVPELGLGIGILDSTEKILFALWGTPGSSSGSSDFSFCPSTIPVSAATMSPDAGGDYVFFVGQISTGCAGWAGFAECCNT